MNRVQKLTLSKTCYAIDLGSLTIDGWGASVNAVWFRRKDRKTAACLGSLSENLQLLTPALAHWLGQTPSSGVEFAELFRDGRYGGRCEARWDGETYWGDGHPEKQAEYLAVLRPMLENYPDIPDGFDGWWRF